MTSRCRGVANTGRSDTTDGTAGLRGTAASSFQGTKFLLQGSDDSSTCLNCHSGSTLSGYRVMTFPLPSGGAAPVQRTPGGDFAWLGIQFAVDIAMHMPASPGERHGHNIIASDFGLATTDTTLLTAPGGSYAASALSCASCHDPHSRARVVDAAGTIATSAFGSKTPPIEGSGSYDNTLATDTADVKPAKAFGVYRLLASSNYSQMSYTNPLAFNANPPVAVAPRVYNRSEAVTDTRVAYGAGMSEWCANCHRSIHNGNVDGANTALIHPAGNTALLTATANNLAGDAAGTTIAAIYNAYKLSGDLTGTQATSYTSLVPYEEGTTMIPTLAAHAVTDGSVTSGPSTGAENVMCLSCHRAHATGFNSMTRWNNAAQFVTFDGQWPGYDLPNRKGNNGTMTSAQCNRLGNHV